MYHVERFEAGKLQMLDFRTLAPVCESSLTRLLHCETPRWETPNSEPWISELRLRLLQDGKAPFGILELLIMCPSCPCARFLISTISGNSETGNFGLRTPNSAPCLSFT